MTQFNASSLPAIDFSPSYYDALWLTLVDVSTMRPIDVAHFSHSSGFHPRLSVLFGFSSICKNTNERLHLHFLTARLLNCKYQLFINQNH